MPAPYDGRQPRTPPFRGGLRTTEDVVEGLRVYRGLLANRPLTRLLFGEFVSGIGDWLYIIAIFVVIYQATGDAFLLGLFGAVRMLPYLLLSVPAGMVADRFERRLVLMVSDIYRGILMVVLAVIVSVHGPTILLVVFAMLAASGSAFFYPAMGAYLPSLVEDERQLGPANSTWATLGNISYILGPAIGGLILAFGTVTLAFVINALTFAFIAAILWRLPPSKGPATAAAPAAETAVPAAEAASTKAAEAAKAAEPTPAPAAPVPVESPSTSSARTAPPARLPVRPLAGLMVIQLMAGFLDGGFQVTTTVLAFDVLKAGGDVNGYLNAAIGIGGLLGGIAAGALVLRRSLGLPLVVGALIMGAGTIALGAAATLPGELVTICVAAAGALIIEVVTTTLFQRLVPNELMGRAVGVVMTVQTVTGMAGALLLPWAVHVVGPLQPLVAVGMGVIGLTGLGSLLVGSAATRQPTPYEAVIERIAKLDLFTGVPHSRLQWAMHRLRETPVVAGQAVVVQGEVADRFYIIESGTYTVTQVQAAGGEPVVLRRLGPDEVFGEIGLLRSSPRTATVTADGDGVVLALEGRDFLTLVGAGGPLQGRLLGLWKGAGTGQG